MNASLMWLPHVHLVGWRITDMLAGVLLCGVATGMYIGANLGPGPRDGLMTGLARRTGRSIRLTRTALEVTVLATGWLLGGTVGVAPSCSPSPSDRSPRRSCPCSMCPPPRSPKAILKG